MVGNQRHTLVQISQADLKPSFQCHLQILPDFSRCLSTHLTQIHHIWFPTYIHSSLSCLLPFSPTWDSAISLAQISPVIVDISFLTKARPHLVYAPSLRPPCLTVALVLVPSFDIPGQYTDSRKTLS